MTRIRFKPRPTWWESGHVDGASGRVVLVAVEPSSLLLRLKGTRQVLRLPFGVAFIRAAWLEAARIRMEKMNARKARRSVKGRR